MCFVFVPASLDCVAIIAVPTYCVCALRRWDDSVAIACRPREISCLDSWPVGAGQAEANAEAERQHGLVQGLREQHQSESQWHCGDVGAGDAIVTSRASPEGGVGRRGVRGTWLPDTHTGTNSAEKGTHGENARAQDRKPDLQRNAVERRL